MSEWELVVVGAAAFVAGLVNSVAGGGSVISFPALIWAGVPPVSASATNSLGLWPGVVSAVFGFRSELFSSRRAELALVLPSFVGGLLGASILLSTPARTFEALAPALVLLATVLIALQDPVRKRLEKGKRREGPAASGVRWWVVGFGAQFLISLYGGYFGAGMGILMLAVLGLMGFSDIHHMNALKNLFAVAIKGSAIVYLIIEGAIEWDAAWVMIASSTVGGYVGARLAYRVGRTAVRRAVIVVGIVMSASLLLKL